MIIKCGRNEYDITERDIIMYNGACYQLITRKVISGWDSVTPILAKGKAEKLIKDGLLKEIVLENPPYNVGNIVYYSI